MGRMFQHAHIFDSVVYTASHLNDIHNNHLKPIERLITQCSIKAVSPKAACTSACHIDVMTCRYAACRHAGYMKTFWKA